MVFRSYLSIIIFLKDNYRQIRPEEHDVLGVGRVIHGLKDNYKQIKPEDHEVLGVGRVIHGLKDNYSHGLICL
jgi:hypothetical protein